MNKSGGRAHSKYSASGAERWFECPGSVELSEGQPDKSSPWALEGTEAHAWLEKILLAMIKHRYIYPEMFKAPADMLRFGIDAAKFIFETHVKAEHSEIMVETRIYLDFIHPEMFGTFDGAVVDHFGTLHVFDYKYGQGHAVSPRENLQMIFYAIGLAHKFQWNFKRVRMWIIQPRIRGYDGPMFWEIPTAELRRYVHLFEVAVERVESNPKLYVEGPHCHWCKAKAICPLKREAKLEQAKSIFSTPLGREHGLKEESLKSEAEWRKETKKKKGRKKEKGRIETQEESGFDGGDWNGGDFY